MEKTKKILLVGPRPNNYKIGGLGIFLNNLLQIKDNGEFEFRVLNDEYPGFGKINKILFNIKLLFLLFKNLRKEKVSIVQIHCNSVSFSFLYKFFQACICKFFSKKIITRFGSANLFNFLSNSNFIWQLIFRYFFRINHLIIAQSEMAKEFYSGYTNRDEIYILPNFVPNKYLPRKISRRRSINGKINVLFIGSQNKKVAKSKGAYSTLKFISSNTFLLRDFNFICIPSSNDLITFSESINLKGKIVFLPKLSISQLHRLYTNIDILLFATENDAMPNTIIELLAHEVPIITTKVGSIPDIIDNGNTGFIIDTKDYKETSDILVLLKSSSLRKEIGKNAKMKFESTYSENIFSSKLAKIYNSI